MSHYWYIECADCQNERYPYDGDNHGEERLLEFATYAKKIVPQLRAIQAIPYTDTELRFNYKEDAMSFICEHGDHRLQIVSEYGAKHYAPIPVPDNGSPKQVEKKAE